MAALTRGTGMTASAVVLVFVFTFPAVPQGPDEPLEPEEPQTASPDETVDETPQLWFVQLASPPVAEDTPRGRLRQERARFHAEAAREHAEFEERFVYENLFNGLSVRATPAEVAKLARTAGVANLWPVEQVEPPGPTTEPAMESALALTGADVVQSELGFTGEGVRVGIIDSGVDYDHPDLGGGFGAGRRVETGFDFVGDDFNAEDPRAQPEPDPDPMDCQGHGTHVAGIVGADGETTGVAPSVAFGAYKVFGCRGTTTADVVLAALEQSLADGMDIVNMSLGATYMWPQYPTSVAADLLVAHGVVVVASIGNTGETGVYSAAAPAVGHSVIGVASYDNERVRARSFELAPGGRAVPYLPLPTTPEPPTEGETDEVAWVGRACPSLGDEFAHDPDGSVALVVRGECTFDEKYQAAADAGATGVVIHNNTPGLFAGGGVLSRGIFAISISLEDGQHIRGQLDEAAVTLRWTEERLVIDNPTGGLISSFSSFGLAPDLTLKPDIGAPGGLIRSTYPLDQGGYATVSGTSMSAPHVAGGAALYLEAHPGTGAADLRHLLQNTAVPQAWRGNPGLGFLDNVHRQGAGMMRIDDAITVSASVVPGKLELGESADGASTQALTVRNRGDEATTFELSHTPALATGDDTFTPSYYPAFASVEFSDASVTVPAGGQASVEATITAPPGPAGGQYGGYLVLTAGEDTLRVPYAGFVGDYQGLVVLEPRDAGFPLLATAVAGGVYGDIYDPVDDGHRFRARDGDVPHVLAHSAHPARRVSLDARHLRSGRTLDVIDVEYVARSASPNGFFAFAWDGTRPAGTNDDRAPAPPGPYVLELSVLKALGDPDDPDHWERWESPWFVID